jgi:hypothetical protein
MQYNNTSESNQAKPANDTLQTSLRAAMLRMRLAEREISLSLSVLRTRG